jgi:hypothetical protein
VSRLEVPVASEIAPALSSATVAYDTLGGNDIVFEVESTPALAGERYVLLVGSSRMVPGFKLPAGGTALLNLDGTTEVLLQAANGPFLPNAVGVLDASGRAVPGTRLNLGQVSGLTALVGLRFNALGVVITSQGRFLATNPVQWVMR